MFDLLPNLDASMAGWAIEHVGPWVVLCGGVLFVWFVFKRGSSDSFIEFSNSSNGDSCASGSTSCGGDGAGGCD